MDTLRKAFGVPVGFSDHTIGLTAASVALAKDACAIERHFTLDRFMEGPDHILSSTPEEMRDLVSLSHLIPLVKGRAEKIILPSETDTANRFKKCLYAKKSIRKGQVITADVVTLKGPGGGILPKHMDIVIGKTARHAIKEDHPIRWEDI
jgi:sialic acid synthase SpsE